MAQNTGFYRLMVLKVGPWEFFFFFFNSDGNHKLVILISANEFNKMDGK